MFFWKKKILFFLILCFWSIWSSFESCWRREKVFENGFPKKSILTKILKSAKIAFSRGPCFWAIWFVWFQIYYPSMSRRFMSTTQIWALSRSPWPRSVHLKIVFLGFSGVYTPNSWFWTFREIVQKTPFGRRFRSFWPFRSKNLKILARTVAFEPDPRDWKIRLFGLFFQEDKILQA